MNKITHTLSPPPKNKKIFQKSFFRKMIFLKNLFKGVGFASLSFNRYNMAQGLLGRSCFKSQNKIKTTPFPTPTLKKFKNSKNLILFVTTFFNRKLLYLILRSGKFGKLVTSFF